MRAIVYQRFGTPEEVLDIIDVPPPRPGTGEVVVTLEAAPVHIADLKHIRGLPWFDGYKPPFSPGYEGVGRISEVGAGVAGWKAGDRVFLPVKFGAWREQLSVPAADLWRAPEGIESEQLALVPINLTTAYLALTSLVTLKPGDHVIQNAANSNVGYYLIRLARQMGIRTINVVRRQERVPGLLEAGADYALVDGPDLPERVRAAIGDAPIRLAIDAIAGDATDRLAACFDASGGMVAAYGLLSGSPCHISPERLMFSDITVKGLFTARTLAGMTPQQVAGIRKAIDGFLVGDPPHTPIAGVYRFDEVRKAVQHAAGTGEDRVGKIILIP